MNCAKEKREQVGVYWIARVAVVDDFDDDDLALAVDERGAGDDGVVAVDHQAVDRPGDELDRAAPEEGHRAACLVARSCGEDAEQVVTDRLDVLVAVAEDMRHSRDGRPVRRARSGGLTGIGRHDAESQENGGEGDRDRAGGENAEPLASADLLAGREQLRRRDAEIAGREAACSQIDLGVRRLYRVVGEFV
jgi:hypothetical protein